MPVMVNPIGKSVPKGKTMDFSMNDSFLNRAFLGTLRNFMKNNYYVCDFTKQILWL